MPVLTARLFGPPAVTIDGKSVALPYKKAEGLLYYLILRRKVSRSELVGSATGLQPKQTSRR